jgi:hypothetical protein
VHITKDLHTDMFAAFNILNTSRFDPDAAAYINLVAASVSVSTVQRNAINAFVKAEKLAGRWTSLKRLYLPIWANATANRICMVSRSASGFFTGGMTHAAGYVQGNGSNGYFDSNVNFNTLATTDSQMVFGLVYVADTGTTYKTVVIAGEAANQAWITWGLISDQMRADNGGRDVFVDGDPTPTNVRANCRGIYINNRRSSTSGNFTVRYSGGFSTLGTFSATPSAGVPNATFKAMGYSEASQRTNACMGAYGCGLGIASPSAFSANLKTLWETCTGLTLP